MELGSLVKKRTHLYFAVEKMTSVASEPLCRGSMAYVGIYWCLERLLQRLNEEPQINEGTSFVCNRNVPKIDFQALERQVWVGCRAETETIGLFKTCEQKGSMLSMGLKVKTCITRRAW